MDQKSGIPSMTVLQTVNEHKKIKQNFQTM